MNRKLPSRADRICNYCVQKIGRAHTRRLVISVGVAYLLGVIKLICWIWVTHGALTATVSIILGLAFHCATSLQQQSQSETKKNDGDYPQHHTHPELVSAERWLCFFLPKKGRDDILGDLQEEYSEICRNLGRQYAKWWLYKQVVTSLWPMLQTAGRNLAKWGLIGWFEEIIRRIAH